jgi:hypothetical protein
MPIDLERELTEGFAARLIREKARQLIRRPEFTRSDLPDLEQEITLHVLQRFEKFDADIAHWNAFVTTLVEHCVASMLEHRSAAKRDESDCVSLSVMVEDGDGRLVEMSQQIGPQHREAVTGRRDRDPADLADLRSDVATVLARLTPEERELCERLKTESLSAIARDKGVPRMTLAYAVQKLRQTFADAGLNDFLRE